MHSPLVASTMVDERYRVLDTLGIGGMGTVYRAEEVSIKRTIALKLLHPSELDDTDSRARFLREGRIISDLSHPSIANFYRLGLYQNAVPFLAMEYLEGQSLKDLINQESKLDWRRVASIALQICAGMQYAHEHRIVHRDLKPTNVMLVNKPERDTVKILDFGLARIIPGVKAVEKLTRTGMLIGSVHYMSPEQCRGQPADARSDIYALGCTIYECLAGEVLFDADNPIAMLHKHVHEPPDFTKLSDVPDGFVTVVSNMLGKSPGERYQSMNEARVDIEKALQGIRVLAVPSSSEDGSSAKQTVRTPLLVVGGLIFLMAFYSCWLNRPEAVENLPQLSSSDGQTPSQLRKAAKRAARNQVPGMENKFLRRYLSICSTSSTEGDATELLTILCPRNYVSASTELSTTDRLDLIFF